MESCLGELIDYYLGPGASECPRWPPDVFGVAAAILNKSGGYRRAVGALLPNDWAQETRRLGREWRARLRDIELLDPRERADWAGATPGIAIPENAPFPPEQVAKWWATLVAGRDARVREIPKHDELSRALLGLLAVADETCEGIGIADPRLDGLLACAEIDALAPSRNRTLCQRVSVDKVRVLPKQHTPQRGLTIRSLSHHLALCSANEVSAYWPHAYRPTRALRSPGPLNILLFPWPFEVSAHDFQPVHEGGEAVALPPEFGLFTFRRHDQSERLGRVLEELIALAKSTYVATLHGVVLPELALTPLELQTASEICLRHDLLLVAGVATPGPPTKNEAVLQYTGAALGAKPSDARDYSFRQSKHHRWCLDHHQVIQYGLGGVLPASRQSWEHTEIADRSIYFVTLSDWLTLSVLVCEDLARQDPMPDVLRAVGPNLVIALLMDGPQIRSRWSSRYAAVLAEDPGSSVLTLTSLGMTRRSRPRGSENDRSRVIALWRDAVHGEIEIELPTGKDACVLSLGCSLRAEYTADGRVDTNARVPVYAGYHILDWTWSATRVEE